jgi:hypothetical protein
LVGVGAEPLVVLLGVVTLELAFAGAETFVLSADEVLLGLEALEGVLVVSLIALGSSITGFINFTFTS